MTRTSKSASKAGPMTPADKQLATYPTHLLFSAVLLATLAFASLAAQLALHPLYGSTPTSLNHSKVKLLACLLSVLLPLDSAWPSDRLTLLGLAGWLGYGPYASFTLGKWTSKWGNPVLGPAIADAMVLVPAMSVGVALVSRWNTRFLAFLPGPMSLKTAVAISAFNCISFLESWLWSHLPLGGTVHSSTIFFTIAGAITISAALVPSQATHLNPRRSAAVRPYKHLIPFFLPVITVGLALSVPPTFSPRLPYSRGTASSRAALSPAPPATVRVLARTHSVTGLVLVGEHVEEHFRFLRVDHSLLGGRWFGEKVAPGSRDGLGDSIYSTFVLQEAVRLAERENKRATYERALFIGLGVGIAAEAFIAHGINTTIVEIDPAVYTYAREYFGLPEPNYVFLEDAREWLHNQATPAADDKFDYVVHDCFSGGSVPEHIFTLQFWDELQGVLKSDGVIAVNFAGKLASEPARAIFLTLQRSFGRCRAFHDHLEAKFDDTYVFFNVVFFCTPLSLEPPTFRHASKPDFLRSHLRRHVLGALAQRELEPSRILGQDEEPDLLAEGEDKWILRDGKNHLGEWQQPNAIEHWTIMREVLPDIFWETY